MSALLELHRVTGGYRDTNVVFDLSATVYDGQVLGVFGRNGVGKTTLARLIQGGITPASGEIRIKGQDTTRDPAWKKRSLGLGYMPQTQMVFDDLTVRQNLELVMQNESPEAYFDIFPRLRERLDQAAGSMSGGERKILAFVRTMIESTDVVILDEPSEGVQPENIDHMAKCIQQRAKAGAAIVLVEQNISFLCSVSHLFLGIDAGKSTLQKSHSIGIEDEIRALLAI